MKTVTIIIIIITILILLFLIKKSTAEVVYVKSDVNGERYLVRDLEDKQKASNMLGRIKKNLITLSEHMEQNKDGKYKDYKLYIERLSDKIYDVEINESAEDSLYTSYSVNKGDELVFCLRSKKYPNKMHDLNLIMYVALHEIAHIGSPKYGHGPDFKKVFAFFANTAIDIGIYEKLQFDVDPHEYCGLTITESIV